MTVILICIAIGLVWWGQAIFSNRGDGPAVQSQVYTFIHHTRATDLRMSQQGLFVVAFDQDEVALRHADGSWNIYPIVHLDAANHTYLLGRYSRSIGYRNGTDPFVREGGCVWPDGYTVPVR